MYNFHIFLFCELPLKSDTFLYSLPYSVLNQNRSKDISVNVLFNHLLIQQTKKAKMRKFVIKSNQSQYFFSFLFYYGFESGGVLLLLFAPKTVFILLLTESTVIQVLKKLISKK